MSQIDLRTQMVNPEKTLEALAQHGTGCCRFNGQHEDEALPSLLYFTYTIDFTLSVKVLYQSGYYSSVQIAVKVGIVNFDVWVLATTPESTW